MIIVINKEKIIACAACSEGIKEFVAAYPTGSLTIDTTSAEQAASLLASPLGRFWGWAVRRRLTVPFRVEVGDGRIAIAGCEGNATAGERGTAVVGDEGNATAGKLGTAVSGDNGRSIAGDWGTALAGNSGYAEAGDQGTATAGIQGTAIVGTEGDAIVGWQGVASAGARGTIRIRGWGDNRAKYLIGYIGEDGLKPNVLYEEIKGRFCPVNA